MDRDGNKCRRDNRLAVLPMLIYGAVYLTNILINGIGVRPHSNDWYGFVKWGLPVGLAIFAGLCLITWFAGALMRLCSSRFGRKKMLNDERE
ncbi:MAG: hypothetical protein IJH90_08600 [Mogibacterium sp.]|nr:hypothetical protein [Mogibacterium sp.]